jgi:hypothetical protein
VVEVADRLMVVDREGQVNSWCHVRPPHIRFTIYDLRLERFSNRKS